eukprot:jgi/Hompol1/517/HPOL_001514-RA
MDVDEQEQEQEPEPEQERRSIPAKPTKPTNRTTTKKNAATKKIFSFDDDDGDGDGNNAPSFKINKKRQAAVVNTGIVGAATSVEASEPTLYSPEELLRLQKLSSRTTGSSHDQDVTMVANELDTDEQRSRRYLSNLGEAAPATHIPDAQEIHAIRKKREMMRAAMSGLEGSAPSFVPLSESTVSKRYGESRLVTEDEELEGQESFADYEGNTISFGPDAAKKATARSMQQMTQEFELAQSGAQDDDETRQWELQQMHKAAFSNGQDIVMGSRQLNVPRANAGHLPIPEISVIPQVPDIIAVLDKEISTLTMLADEHKSQLNVSIAEIEASETAARHLDTELAHSSARYEYFQQLSTFVVDLDEFIDAKMTTLEELEQDLLALRLKDSKSSESTRQAHLDSLFETFSGVAGDPHAQDAEPGDAILPERSVEEIHDTHSQLLQDAAEQFRLVSAVKDRFQTWKWKYPKDYDQAYGALSLAGAFDFYVRYEMFGTQPFITPLELESMAWHQELSTFGVTDSHTVNPDEPEAMLLTKIIEKTVIPRIVAQLELMDCFSRDQTQLAIRFFAQLLDYTDRKSPAFKTLIDAAVGRIKHTLDTLAKHVAHSPQFLQVSDRGAAVAAKTEWFNHILQMLENAVAWRRYVEDERLQALVVGLGVDHTLIKALDGSLFFEDDLMLYEKILHMIPKDWIVAAPGPGEFQTPALLKHTERCFIRNVVEASQATRDAAMLKRMLDVCVLMRSFDQASKLSKRIKKSE